MIELPLCLDNQIPFIILSLYDNIMKEVHLHDKENTDKVARPVGRPKFL